MSTLLPCVEIEPQAGPADASIVWLHGLGADGHDFANLVPELGLPEKLRVRFVFPHAPSMPVTINQGYVMPSWFDILSLGSDRSINVPQLLASAAAVHALVDREMERGVESERILLAGFSQGGAVNYQAGLTYDKPLGGILALSTYFPTAGAIEVHPANDGIPILICHGEYDGVLPLQYGERSQEYLRRLGFHPAFRVYQMEHGVCAQEVADISDWIQEILL